MWAVPVVCLDLRRCSPKSGGTPSPTGWGRVYGHGLVAKKGRAALHTEEPRLDREIIPNYIHGWFSRGWRAWQEVSQWPHGEGGFGASAIEVGEGRAPGSPRADGGPDGEADPQGFEGARGTA